MCRMRGGYDYYFPNVCYRCDDYLLWGQAEINSYYPDKLPKHMIE